LLSQDATRRLVCPPVVNAVAVGVAVAPGVRSGGSGGGARLANRTRRVEAERRRRPFGRAIGFVFTLGRHNCSWVPERKICFVDDPHSSVQAFPAFDAAGARVAVGWPDGQARKKTHSLVREHILW